MAKLHMKRTPAEERERELRKARKAVKKASRRSGHRPPDYDDPDVDGPFWDSQDESERSRKRRRTSRSHSPPAPRPPAPDPSLDDSDSEQYGPPPPPRSYEDILREIEEQRFREKMLDAADDNGFGYNARLDDVEARFNTYAHVPRRWQAGHSLRTGMEERADADPHARANPQHMDDDEYAEWVRAGMWRRTHGAEYEAEQTRLRGAEEKRKREEDVRRETRRLERAAKEERRKRRAAKECRRWTEYEDAWKAIYEEGEEQTLRFVDVPWPVGAKGKAFSEDELTPDAIFAFLFSARNMGTEPDGADEVVKQRRDKIRATLLRFHPDKFEGRAMSRVREEDRERVKEAVGRVARALNTLMSQAGT